MTLLKHDTTKREADDKRAETKPQSKFQRPRAPRGATRAPEARRDAAPPARDPLEAYHGHADVRGASIGRERTKRVPTAPPPPRKRFQASLSAHPRVAFGLPKVPATCPVGRAESVAGSGPKADRKRTESGPKG